jgi:hypothetical protein
MAKPGTIIAIVIIVIIVIVVLLFVFVFNKKSTAGGGGGGGTTTSQCAASDYVSANPPQCDLATGTETKVLTAGNTCMGAVTLSVPNSPVCDCGLICVATNTCVGPDQIITYSAGAGLACNATCIATPATIVNQSDCEVKCPASQCTVISVCDQVTDGKQVIQVSGGSCPPACIPSGGETSISNANCVIPVCSSACNKPNEQLLITNPDGTISCGPGLPIPCFDGTLKTLPFSISTSSSLVPVKLTNFYRGTLNPPQYLSVNPGAGGAGSSVIYQTDAQIAAFGAAFATYNQWYFNTSTQNIESVGVPGLVIQYVGSNELAVEVANGDSDQVWLLGGSHGPTSRLIVENNHGAVMCDTTSGDPNTLTVTINGSPNLGVGPNTVLSTLSAFDQGCRWYTVDINPLIIGGTG